MFNKNQQQKLPQRTSVRQDAVTSVPSPEARTTSAAYSSEIGGQGLMPSILSPDAEVRGDITSSGDLQVEGSVKGDITSRSVTIGEQAHVEGSITGEVVHVCGIVSGQITGTKVNLTRTARVIGDVTHDVLGVESGAHVEGHMRRRPSVKGLGSEMSAEGLVQPIDVEAMPVLTSTPAIAVQGLASSLSERPSGAAVKSTETKRESQKTSEMTSETAEDTRALGSSFLRSRGTSSGPF